MHDFMCHTSVSLVFHVSYFCQSGVSCDILLSVWCFMCHTSASLVFPHVRPMFSLWIGLSKLRKTPCGKSSTGDRLLLCVMWKASIAFSFLSVYQPQKKIFIFPPLAIIGLYNAHRNPISYTFWKLHPVWPVPSSGCMVCLLLIATSDPSLFGSLLKFVLKMLRLVRLVYLKRLSEYILSPS
jgi:hypothetical protein